VKSWMRLSAVVIACVATGVVVALVLLVTWLHTSSSHTVEALQYLITSAAVSLALGALALLLLSRYLPNLALKIGVASAFASAAAILNVLYTPWMMFSSRNDLYLLLITLIYFVTISLAFAFIIATITTRQLQALHLGATRIASGKFGTRVQVQGTDEIADLANAFNRMSTELEQHFARERQLEHARRDLIAAVSHDLRTPLTSIRAMVEAINDGVVHDKETERRYLGLIQSETEHLGRLIEDLFELSRIESGSLELKLSTIPLAELVSETVEVMKIQGQKKGVEVLVKYEGETPALPLDGPRIQRVLVNLIQNAIRHTPAGGRVQVQVGRRNGHVEVTVADSGEGIAPEDRSRVFDQFYRGEKSRSRESGGAGLGLAIAKGIVEAHCGSIQVESNHGKGSRFVVTLS
jgi:signal transduction histidine kinase